MVFCHQPTFWPVDGAGPKCFRGKDFTHLTADTEKELVAYAKEIGLNVSWIQKAGTPDVHFDITGKWLQLVLLDRRVEKLDVRAYVAKIQARRKAVR